MKKNCIIINAARGGIINETDLDKALNDNLIFGAGLDVFEIEPPELNNPYWVNEKVTVTPHIASVTRASSSCDVIAKNILRGERGDSFLYLVDRKKGY